MNGFKFENAYGTANEHLPNTLTTHFNIGSNTKMMTSIAIAKMIEDGHLQLDTPIYEEDLGPQMIGFSRVRDYIERFSSFDTEFALEQPKSYQYCNFGIDLLGLAIEAITGDYYQYVHDNVLNIAGMEETVPLRQPGPTFAVPYLTPTSIPIVPILQNPEREKVLIKDVLTYAQTFSRYAKQIDLLIAEYHLGLLERTPDEFSAFKMEMMRKIEPIFNALKHPAHLDIIMGVLNSLSMASPSGRNMYSTVDDMLKFEEAINTGTLSSYNSHLTTNTAPFENNHSMRYSLGCFISGNHDDPEYTIAHGGYAPGMHSAFRSLPNLGYANDSASQLNTGSKYRLNLKISKQTFVKLFQSIPTVFAHVGSLGMGVLAPYRGQGVGIALISAALQKARSKGLTRIELTVREKNTAAIALYKKFGFVIEGVHKNGVCIDGEYENHIFMALLFDN